MTTTADTTHGTAPTDQEPRQAWNPVLGEFRPIREVYGYDSDDPDDDDLDEHGNRLTDVAADTARATFEVGLLAIVAAAVERDRAFRARPITVRRALRIRHRRAVRRARRQHRHTARSSR